MLNRASAPTIVWKPNPSSTPVECGQDAVPARSCCEEHERREGDDELGDDDADVGQRLERAAEPRGARCRPSAAIVPTIVAMIAVAKPTIRLLNEVPLDLAVVEDVLVPAEAEALPVGHASLGGVEAEDHDDDDRDVQEQVDERGVAT